MYTILSKYEYRINVPTNVKEEKIEVANTLAYDSRLPNYEYKCVLRVLSALALLKLINKEPHFVDYCSNVKQDR